MNKCIEDLSVKELAEATRNLAYERAGGSPSESNYDPELLSLMCAGADRLDAVVALLQSLKGDGALWKGLSGLNGEHRAQINQLLK